MQHNVPITNGKGNKELADGTYTVTSSTIGYDDSSITPAEQEITEGVHSYSFTIAATGTLTIHVSDDGTEIGVPIVGATFVRCDADGATYGEPITSDDSGNAVFNFVPFAAESAPAIYFKQTASDGEHTFNADLQNTTMDSETATLEIENAQAAAREFTLTDANYADLPIADGEIILTSN